MREVFGLCGTPGTGKKTLAPLVASSLGVAPVSLNSLAPAGEVDTRVLRRSLLKTVRGRALVFGHLLPHVLRKEEVAFVAVLRCEPTVLRDRLTARGYPPAKVVENLEAELIGVVLDECVRRFGPSLVGEYDTTSSSPGAVAAAIARGATKPRRPSGGRRRWIDWTLRYGSADRLASLLGGGGLPERGEG